jgi:hypothetical protein
MQDEHIKALQGKHNDLGTIEMIVNIYFPELNFAFQALVVKRLQPQDFRALTPLVFGHINPLRSV